MRVSRAKSAEIRLEERALIKLSFAYLIFLVLFAPRYLSALLKISFASSSRDKTENILP